MTTQRNEQPYFYTREALRNIDSEATSTYKIPSIVLMENASKNAAHIIQHSVCDMNKRNIVILCGQGNNGGDGYAIARHLKNNDYAVSILEFGEPKSPDAIVNASVCSAMNIPRLDWDESKLHGATLCIDAIFGTGLDRKIEGKFANAIQTCNDHPATCVSIDIPSGLDCNQGIPLGVCIEASLTISFVGQKIGFQKESAKKYLGEVVVADIGCPKLLLKTYGSTST